MSTEKPVEPVTVKREQSVPSDDSDLELSRSKDLEEKAALEKRMKERDKKKTRKIVEKSLPKVFSFEVNILG